MKFKRIKYPDGQISAWLESEDGILTIKERINSYEDLIYVVSQAQVLNSMYTKATISLFIPCLFTQRSDRKFHDRQSFDLMIVAGILNSCKFERVRIFDPHSDVSLALIDRSQKWGPQEFVDKSVREILKEEQPLVLVSPDAGAYKKTFEIAENLKLELVAANKHRTLSGEISLTVSGNVRGADCLIVDDLCDGGATFIAIANKLKELGAVKVYLYVSHGLFSKGVENVLGPVDHIFCTNSHHDVEHPRVTQYKVI